MPVRCSPHGTEAEFAAHCLEIESRPAIAESHLHGHLPAQTARHWYVRQVAGTHRHHRLTDLSLAAALVGRLVGLLIVGRASRMVLSAVVVAAAAAAAAAAAVAVVAE